jgi:hypothetical protein
MRSSRWLAAGLVWVAGSLAVLPAAAVPGPGTFQIAADDDEQGSGQPAWTKGKPSRWSDRGLTLVVKGSPAKEFLGEPNEEDMAEESAMLEARRRAVEALVGALSSSTTIGQNRLARGQAALSTSIGKVQLILEDQYYDTSGKFPRMFVKVLVPKDVLSLMVERALDVKVAVGSDGTFTAQK